MRFRYTNVPSLLQGEMEPDEAVCYRCGCFPVEFHHCLTGAKKSTAERIGAWVWLCPKCHSWAHSTADGVKYLRELKAECQSHYQGSDWMALVHRNYLGDYDTERKNN